MSLKFGDNTTDRVDYGNPSIFNTITQGAIMFWFRPDDEGTAFRHIIGKLNATVTAGWGLERSNANNIKLFVFRATTNQILVSNSEIFSQGKWSFITVTWDTVNGGPRIYCGSLTDLVIDVSDLGTLTDGSGSQNNDNSGPLLIGNGEGPSVSWPCDIAHVALFNLDLDLQEIRQLQYNPALWGSHRNCIMNSEYKTGTNVQPDLSIQGNLGTVLGSPIASGHLYFPDIVGPFKAPAIAANPWFFNQIIMRDRRHA